MADGVRKRRPSMIGSDEDGYGSDDDKKNSKEVKQLKKDLESEKYIQEEEIPDSRWGKIKASVTEWGETSSCHGIPHMAQASTKGTLILWLIILIIGALGCAYFIYDTLKQYLQFDKIVTLNYDMSSMNFPSVTFCNMNPYKLSQVQAIPELEALLIIYEQAGTNPNII